MNFYQTISKIAALFILFAVFLPAYGQRSDAANISIENVVDLTHTLNEDFPFIPIPGITFPFKRTPIATIDKMGVAANRWDIHEHIGTQIDAPSHFFADGTSLEQMPVRNFIAPLAVIDISEHAATDADAAVTVEDVKNWEKLYGRLPKGAAVFMRSGWDAKIKNAKAFINLDDKNTMHFPGFSPEAATFLARERDVVGIGVDTLSLDPGRDKEYKAHKAWLAAGKWGVECVANLKDVPPVGATVFVGSPKVEGATGGLTRLIAVFPSSILRNSAVSRIQNELIGKWKSAEAVGNIGFRMREFIFTPQRWQIKATFFSDKKMTKPLFSFAAEGSYKIEKSAAALPKANNAVFYFDKKSLTLLTNDASSISRFNFDRCNLKKGIAKDISQNGCANFSSVAACGQEYDLVNIEREVLRLGARPLSGDMCSAEKRPKNLGQLLIREIQ